MERRCDLWQTDEVKKALSSRNIIGIMTVLLWVFAGVFIVFRGVDSTWRLAGFGVVAVGIFRAFMLMRYWDKNQSIQEPLRVFSWRTKHESSANECIGRDRGDEDQDDTKRKD